MRGGSVKLFDFSVGFISSKGRKSLIQTKGERVASSTVKVSIFRIIFFHPGLGPATVIGVSK